MSEYEEAENLSTILSGYSLTTGRQPGDPNRATGQCSQLGAYSQKEGIPPGPTGRQLQPGGNSNRAPHIPQQSSWAIPIYSNRALGATGQPGKNANRAQRKPTGQ